MSFWWLLGCPPADLDLTAYAGAAHDGGHRRPDLGGVVMADETMPPLDLPRRRRGEYLPPAPVDLSLLRCGLSDAAHDTEPDEERRIDVWRYLLDHNPSCGSGGVVEPD